MSQDFPSTASDATLRVPNIAELSDSTQRVNPLPLTDEDRWPWLQLVGAALSAESPKGVVVACSALRRTYRDAIRGVAPSTAFILLEAATPVLQDRMTLRPGHFMPASLLTSQLETLEPLEADESGLLLTSEEGIESTAERACVQLANLI